MTHVSRKRLKKEVATELADQFLTFLSLARTKTEARILANELFSQTERVMLAKRLAIVVLLVRGYSFTQIEEALGVTRQTVIRVWKDMKTGKYDKIVRYAREYTKHFKKEGFMETLIRIIHVGMPPRAGRGRWKFLNKSLSGSMV
ncbi:MAG: Trp family transcriptional regulator [Patescibacteria group bacterium]